ISLDISDIPCYTFQFVRRFGSGEEPNYTPAGENSQYFQRDFLGKFVMSLSDKVFYLRQTLRRLQPPPSSSPPADAPL
ncbi:hypothetical protein QWX96_10460, partial [Neisseria gonorrhoeae]